MIALTAAARQIPAERESRTIFPLLAKPVTRLKEYIQIMKQIFAREAPVTLIIDEIEALWSALAERDDWSHFETKVKTIRDLGGALRGPAPTK